MTFTTTPPTTPGFYAWRVKEGGRFTADFFDLDMISEWSERGGEWCRLVPADEARITCESAIAAMTAFQAERDQLRKVCDELASMLYYYGKTNGYPKWGKEFDELNAVIKAYNQLPHVKK